MTYAHSPIYGSPSRERCVRCPQCGDGRIRAGMLRAHLATVGHPRHAWSRAEYRAHVLDTYGTIPAAHAARLAAMPATGRVRLFP